MESNYAMGYQGRTYDYGEYNKLGLAARCLCFLVGLMLFGVLWLMFKPVDLVARLRGTR